MKITLHQFALALRQLTLAACFLIAAQSTPATAQPGLLQDDAFCGDCCEHDLQFFSPVDFDFDCQPIKKDCGYFFKYDKLNWAATGERTTIGDPNVVVMSEIIYRLANLPGFSDTDRVPQYVIENGLQNVKPPAAFGWGERYEFGRLNKGNGWSIGYLDGPEISSATTFGGGPQGSGFGSIHINFVTPQDYLRGFRDYFNNDDDEPGVVTNGPGGRIVDGVLILGTDNGVPDDLDGDLAEGVGVLVDAEDNAIAIITDFDDSSLFNVRFNQLTLRNTTETQGVELMHVTQLTNSHKMKKHQNSRAEIGYGVRYLRLRDTFSLNGTSDLFRGANFVTTSSENHIVGPQIRGRWSLQRGRFNTSVDGRFVWGYNIQDLDQTGTWGENLLTGGLNQPEVAQPTTFNNGRRDDDFSPLAELRINSSYQITSSIALQLGYTAIFIDNISRASQLVQYRLPDWGISEGSQQEIFINGVNFGFDVVY